LVDDRAQLARPGRDGGGHQVGIGVAVARRVGRGGEVVAREVRPARAHLVGRQHAGVHPHGALEGRALGVEATLLLGLLQDEVAVLAEVGIHTELRRESLVDLDGPAGQLDADAIGVLVADAAAGQRGRAGADRVALQHDDAAVFPPREAVGGGGAHDPGPDDDRVRGLGHGARIIAPRPATRRPPRAMPQAVRVLRNELLRAILPPANVKRSQPSTSTRRPSAAVPVKRHSDTARSPATTWWVPSKRTSGKASKIRAKALRTASRPTWRPPQASGPEALSNTHPSAMKLIRRSTSWRFHPCSKNASSSLVVIMRGSIARARAIGQFPIQLVGARAGPHVWRRWCVLPPYIY